MVRVSPWSFCLEDQNILLVHHFEDREHVGDTDTKGKWLIASVLLKAGRRERKDYQEPRRNALSPWFDW